MQECGEHQDGFGQFAMSQCRGKGWEGGRFHYSRIFLCFVSAWVVLMFLLYVREVDGVAVCNEGYADLYIYYFVKYKAERIK